MVPVELPQCISMVFYRCLYGCKTMPILRNVIKSDTIKGDIIGYSEQW